MNVSDYVRWRGDVTFKISPFNEVDNLVLTQLPYLKYQSFLNENDSLTIRELYNLYLEHVQPNKENPLDAQRSELLKNCALSLRYGELKVMHYVSELDEAAEKQFSALCIQLPDHIIYVSYEGTDATMIGWKENLNMTFRCPVPAQERARQYLNHVMSKHRFAAFIVGGHSKGGNLAVYASATCRKQDRIIHVYNNDGPGFEEKFLESDGYKMIQPRITTYTPVQSVIGRLLNNHTKQIIVVSEADEMIWQHSVLTWQVDVSKLVEADENSSFSTVIQQTLNRWADNVSTEEKIVFLNTVFDILKENDINYSYQLSSNKVKLLTAIFKALPNYSEETRGIMIDVTKLLLKNNLDSIYDVFFKREGKKKHEDPDS